MTVAEAERDEAPGDFVRAIVGGDIAAGRTRDVVTRFPPEPNGYLHIGHAKSIVLNFGVAGEFGGRCHLRFDDTNPVKEETAFIDSIQADVRWLGYDWGEHLHFASDHFDRLYEWAEHLVREGKAYVDDSSADEIRAMRGTLTEPGTESPCRDRPAAESLDLLRRMRAGEFEEGARVLRARIDMASGNINLRDPVLYRILRASHPRTGETWRIYPTYDFAHGQSDAIEGVTHSLCTLEFADHRPLYDWLIDNLPVPARPRQYEFARLNLAHTVLSKRRLIRLVEEGHVAGWDDPRMPTLAGLRRRGVPPAAIRDFAQRIGVARADNLVDPALLDHCIRDALNDTAERRLAVLRPLKVVIENWPEGRTEMLPPGTTPTIRAPAAAKSRSAAKSGSSGTTSWRTRRENSTGSLRAARCGCATPISSPAPAWRRTRRESPCCSAAPTIRRPGAGTRRTAARCGAPSTGSPPPTPCPPRSGSTTTCSRCRSRAPTAISSTI